MSISSIENKFHQVLISEKDSFFLWIPVLFGIGIITYFKLPFEPNIKISIAIPVLLIVGAYFFKKTTALLWCLIVLLILSSGFLTANIRTISINAPVLSKKIGIKSIQGAIENIESRPRGKRFVLTDLKIEGFEKNKTPKKIRVNINTKDSNAKAGDVISILAHLSPPPKAVIPGGYDFSRFAYFRQIGAVGYAVSNVKILYSPQNLTLSQYISAIRQTIKQQILAYSKNTDAHIAIALLVGEKGGIDKNTINNIRVSGIAHILAISGMHLSLVAAIFFFLSRLIFASIGKLALNYNIKKWAAIIAIFGSFVYLLISGVPISAQRAFIMTSLILIAIIIDRAGTPMRSVSLAALLILIATPESILTPSFQMSFAAVFALIALYELSSSVFTNYREFGLLKKALIYLSGIVFSSAIAGIATAPFAIYHFNNFAPYGIITNLIVVPITSLFVMPFGVITLLLMPFGLEQIGLKPMLLGIDVIVKTANYVASLPQPIGAIGQMSDLALGLITIGGVFFIILKTKVRYFGLIFIVFGIFYSLNKQVPNIIIGGDAKLFAVKVSGDTLAFSSKVSERYSRTKWEKRFAISEPILISKADKDIINCDSKRCIYKHGEYLTAIVKHPIALENDCQIADIVINMTYIKYPCKKARILISKRDILKNGTHTIAFEGGNLNINSVAKANQNRPWQN